MPLFGVLRCCLDLKSEVGGSAAGAFPLCSYWKLMVESQLAPGAWFIPQPLPGGSSTLWYVIPTLVYLLVPRASLPGWQRLS